MNIHLKSAVQNLDAHILEVTEIRNRLAGGLGPVIGKDVFPPAAAETAALPGKVVQTRGRERTKRRTTNIQHRTSKAKRGNGGGRKESSEIEAPSSKTSESALTTPAARASTVAGKKVETVAGAMKLEIAGRGGREFTADDLRTALAAKYGGEEWWENASASALSGNLSYWSSKGRLEKTATGYRAKEAEFFENVEY